MGSFIPDIKIRFRLGRNQTILSLLEDPNLSYNLDNYETDLKKIKFNLQKR